MPMTIAWNSPAERTIDVRADRKSQLIPIEIASDRVTRTKVVIRNMSTYGLGVRGDIELLACERVKVFLPGGREIGATVRWARKNTYGLALDEAINPALLQPKPVSRPSEIVTRDDNPGFRPLVVKATTQRPGFVRSNRDEILHSASRWTSD